VHLQEEEGEQWARYEEHPQDEEHHWDMVHPREVGEEDEVRPLEEGEEEGAHSWEHCRPDLDDISSPPEWHHLAGQP